jgi:transposase-like protein
MSKKGQKYRKHSIEFKHFIVQKRIKDGYGKNKLCRIYHISSENVIKWTRRYLAGEPLEMKRGRPSQTKRVLVQDDPLTTLQKENDRLKVELAYKTELLNLLESRADVKKKTNLESSIDCDPHMP